MSYCVYAIFHPHTGEPVYIGQTGQPLEVRLREHKTNVRNRFGNRHLVKFLTRYPSATISLVCPCHSEADARIMERRYINSYAATWPDLLNIAHNPHRRREARFQLH